VAVNIVLATKKSKVTVKDEALQENQDDGQGKK
jgi:hypothetical protein